MKRRKRKTKSDFKVIYEYIPSPDAAERVNKTFDIIFDKIDLFDFAQGRRQY